MTRRIKNTTGVVILYLLLIFPFISCNRETPHNRFKVDAIGLLLENDKRWSLFGSDGLFKCVDSLAYMPSITINGLFSMANPDGSFSLWNAMGEKPEMLSGCENLYSVGFCNNGLIPVCSQNSRIRVLDTSGNQKFVLIPINNQEIIETGISFRCDRLMVMTSDGKYGYCDTRGKMVILPQYFAATFFSEDKALVETAGNGNTRQFKLIDKQGNTIFTFPKHLYPITYYFSHGRMVVRKDGKELGFIDSRGKFKAALKEAKGIGHYDEEFYSYMNSKGFWGVVTYKGKEVLPNDFLSIEHLPDDNFLVQSKNWKFKVLDRRGSVKLDFSKYDHVSYYYGLGFICSNGSNHYYLLNKNGIDMVKRPIADIGEERTASRTVRTNYYRSPNIISQLADAVSVYGLGKYKLGNPVSWFHSKTQPDAAMVLQRSFEVKNMFINDKEAQFKVWVHSDLPLARINLNASPNNRYYINPNARIRTIEVDIDYTNRVWEANLLYFTRMITNKGFQFVKVAQVGDNRVRHYKSYGAELYVMTSKDSGKAKILLMQDKEADKYQNQMISK